VNPSCYLIGKKGGCKTMKKTILLIILFLLLPGILLAEVTIKPSSNQIQKIEKKTCDIRVTSPVYNQYCHINQACPIAWDTSNIKNQGSVFLIVVQIDAQHIGGVEGGGYPVSNTGNYQWIVPENVGPLTDITSPTTTIYQIKVITPDHECSGKSSVFNITKRTVLPKIPVQQYKK
jgi:hypothetical protein